MAFVRTYLGNAVSKRDFRVQLRGSRSVVILGVYLFLLIAISLFVYAQSTSQGMSLAQAQEGLRGFYATVMGLVAFAAVAIATATGATAIVMEVQRRQLELVTMTAAPPRYLLVGKLVSSFRYTWMILALSLPVAASCVVLGGATWTAVLLTYVMISLQALLGAAIGLAISCHVNRPTAAIGWSFAAVVFYGFVATTASVGAAVSGVGRAVSGRGVGTIPYTVLLSPASIALPEYMDTSWPVFGVAVPNILLAGLIVLLIVRYLLHVGGLAIGHRSPKTIARFRLDSLLTVFLLNLGLGATVAGTYSAALSSFSSATSVPGYSGPSTSSLPPPTVALGWFMALTLMAVVPNLSTYGFDGLRLARPDGLVKPRETLSGRPSGGLPYALLLVLGGTLGHIGGFSLSLSGLPGTSLGPFAGLVAGEFLYGALFLMAFAFALWGATRYFASGLTGAKAAATLGVAFAFLLVFGPVALLAFGQVEGFGGTEVSGWDLFLLRPFTRTLASGQWTYATHGLFLLVLGFALALASERRRVRVAALPPKLVTHVRT